MAWRILIVDDEPVLQSMVGEILTQAGYETESAPAARRRWNSFASLPRTRCCWM